MKRKNFEVPDELQLKDIPTKYNSGLDPLTVKKELKNLLKKRREYQLGLLERIEFFLN